VKLKGIFSTAVAIAFGALVLAGYLFGHAADGSLTLLGKVQLLILNVAVILVGFAVLAGVINLTQVHVSKIRRKQKGSAYSVILIVALVITFLLGFLARFLPVANSLFGGIFNAVQLPVEKSLMALLVVTLTYASIRLLRRNLNVVSIIFLVTAFLILVGMAPWPFLGDVPFLSDTVRPIITQIPASSGARGILIGIALGTLTTGLRILFGSDRPYGGKRG
jgi:hypothetical protein